MLSHLAHHLRNAILASVFAVAATLAAAETPLNTTPDGVAMDGFDVVAYFIDGAPAKGLAENAVEHQGATWLFASAEHAGLFRADPAKYAPMHNGWCSYAVSEGYGAEVDFVNGWTVIDDALYLNWNAAVRDRFAGEKDRRIPASRANWPEVAAGLADGTVKLYRHTDDPKSGITHPQRLN